MYGKIYGLRARAKRGVEEQHRKRTLHDMDGGSTLTWTKEGDGKTAHWTFDGTRHHIVINEEIPSLITNKAMLALPPHKRKELQYVKAVHNHEVMHSLYTSRDFEGINAECAKLNIPFVDVNLFEDGRGEGLMRNKRPMAKMGGKKDLDHQGNYTVESHTYGVRKFEWCKWDEFNLDNPRNALLSFIKCEGTAVNLAGLLGMWDKYIHDGKLQPIAGGEGGFKSTRGIKTYNWFLALWRKFAGRGADKRFPTTESLLPLIKMFNELFPIPPGEGPGKGLGGTDYEEAAKKSGVKPHHPHAGTGSGKSTATKPEELVPTTKTLRGVHDKKKGVDESKEGLPRREFVERGLDPNYFTWDG